MENLTVDDAYLVAQMSEERAKLMVPVVIYISLMMVSGFIGNIMVIVFYGFVSKMTTTTFFIVMLALFDFVASCVTMPNEIFVIKNLTYEMLEACKAIRFIDYTVGIGSVLTLFAIAIDRYNRINRRSSTQIKIQSAKIIGLVILLVSLVLSWPALLLYSTVERPLQNEYNRTLLRNKCSITKDLSTYIIVFNGIHLILFATIATSVCVLYSRVVKVIFRHKKALLLHYKNNAKTNVNLTPGEFSIKTSISVQKGRGDFDKHVVISNSAEVLTKISNTDIAEAAEQSDDGVRQKTECDMSKGNDTIPKNETSNVTSTSKIKQSANYRDVDIETLKVTFVMIVVTALLLLSFLPFLFINIWSQTISAEEWESISGTRLVLLQISIRSYLINSGLNPWVYGILNSSFREYFFKRCFRGCNC